MKKALVLLALLCCVTTAFAVGQNYAPAAVIVIPLDAGYRGPPIIGFGLMRPSSGQTVCILPRDSPVRSVPMASVPFFRYLETEGMSPITIGRYSIFTTR